jgi:uncharacterized membrane protein
VGVSSENELFEWIYFGLLVFFFFGSFVFCQLENEKNEKMGVSSR